LKSLRLRTKIVEWPMDHIDEEPLYQAIVYDAECEELLEESIQQIMDDEMLSEDFQDKHVFICLGEAADSYDEAGQNLRSLLKRIINNLKKRV
jgi:hypothetical protein